MEVTTCLASELKTNKKLFPNHLPFILHGAPVGASSLWPKRQGSTKHEQARKVQAFSQSNTLKLFCPSELYSKD
jgi:hypothetical protein